MKKCFLATCDSSRHARGRHRKCLGLIIGHKQIKNKLAVDFSELNNCVIA